MKNIYTFLILLFTSFNALSQDKKISIEVNYPIELAQGFDEVTGLVNAGLKYRFAQGELFTYGAGLSADYLSRGNSRSHTLSFEEIERDFFFIHLGGFAELKIPNNQKLHPFAGIGFTYLTYDYLYITSYYDYAEFQTRTERNPGYNMSFGIQYDISSSFFLQSYFQFIRTFDKSELNDEEITGMNTNHFKLGVGYRF